MIKTLYTIVFTCLLFTACKKKGIDIIDDNNSQYVITGEATLPDSVTVPRIVYNDGAWSSTNFLGTGLVSATWRVNEQIEFLFIQGTKKLKALGKVTSFSGSNCKFQVLLPVGTGANNLSSTQSFDVYAVTAGVPSTGTLTTVQKLDYITAGQTTITLNTNTTEIKDNLNVQSLANNIVQVASAKNTPAPNTNPKLQLNFKHLGSLMAFSVKNVAGYAPKLTALTVTDPSSNWVYPTGVTYDLTKDAPGNPASFTGTATKTLTFFTGLNQAFAIGSFYTFYKWFIPTANPASNLSLNLSLTWDDGSNPQTEVVSLGDKGVLQEGQRYKISNRYLHYTEATDYYIDSNP